MPGVDYRQFGNFLSARGSSDHTVEAYVKDLKFIERKLASEALDITPDDLDRLFSRKGLSPARNQRLKHAWNAFCKFAAKRLNRPDVPIAEYEAKVRWKPKPSLTPDERLSVFRACFSSDASLEDGQAVALLLHTGMRREEATTRTCSDISGNRLTILGKEDKTRIVPLARREPCFGVPSAFDLVKALTDGKNGNNFVISHASDPSRPWSNSRLYEACGRIGKLAGLPDLTPHQLRRGWATDLRRRGIDIAIISRLLGHSSLSVTQRYLGVGDYDIDTVQRILEDDSYANDTRQRAQEANRFD